MAIAAIWQWNYALHIFYHRLCQTPQKYLVTALNNFLAALKANRKFAKQFAEVMVQVGQDTELSQIESQGVQLVDRAKLLYKQAYRQGASIESIREAIQDLRDFLTMFPDYQLAKNFKKALEKGLEKRFNQIKDNQEV